MAARAPVEKPFHQELFALRKGQGRCPLVQPLRQGYSLGRRQSVMGITASQSLCGYEGRSASLFPAPMCRISQRMTWLRGGSTPATR